MIEQSTTDWCGTRYTIRTTVLDVPTQTVSPLKFWNDDDAIIFLRNLSLTSCDWRAIVQTADHRFNLHHFNDQALFQQLATLLQCYALFIYRTDQLTLARQFNDAPLNTLAEVKYHLSFGDKEHSHSQRAQFKDEADALALLQRLSNDPKVWRDLHTTVTQQLPTLKQDKNHSPEDALAAWLHQGKISLTEIPNALPIVTEALVPLSSASSVTILRDTSNPDNASSSNDNSTDASNDADISPGKEKDLDAQVDTLVKAAVTGAPFCEECESA